MPRPRETVSLDANTAGLSADRPPEGSVLEYRGGAGFGFWGGESVVELSRRWTLEPTIVDSR